MFRSRLYEQHDQAYCSQFANIEQAAAAQDVVLVGAPGTIIQHKRAGVAYYARQYMGPEGKKQEESLGGPLGDPSVEARVQAVRERIEVSKSLIARIRELAKLGFQIADNKTFATMGVLFNHGLFQAGAVLIGSHAYAILLNSVGIKTISYETEDIDLARGHLLALDNVPTGGLLSILKETGINFVEVPPMTRGAPSTSFKQAGATRFHVDLLVPSKDDTFPIVPVPELNAHATGLPYLAYLLGESQMATLISRHGAVPVRVPSPARFAIHKLLVSRLRTSMLVKSSKDVQQACVLLAMLGEHRTGDIEDACAALPRSSRALARRVLPEARQLLEPAHGEALIELETGLKK
ncbi:GSU2403 family nucleotidyltransferase fold protein [Burkholderia catarinensis]|uniref:GSU2403 family nucleotidyltransferase fold protein n=1 Tax=Burkholderia catarinensis TaxID=1108140 RepID=UPI00091C1A35|nr:GSU2403 family nucleotidyltransferase fold protein [Burkholderia catarinensis]KAG8154804.1 hypothetical protein BFF94_004355 [Burkholderia catarinensis]